jgi:hypothetical protein
VMISVAYKIWTPVANVNCCASPTRACAAGGEAANLERSGSGP